MPEHPDEFEMVFTKDHAKAEELKRKILAEVKSAPFFYESYLDDLLKLNATLNGMERPK